MADSYTIALFKAGTAEYRRVQMLCTSRKCFQQKLVSHDEPRWIMYRHWTGWTEMNHVQTSMYNVHTRMNSDEQHMSNVCSCICNVHTCLNQLSWGADTAHQLANGACWCDQVVWALPNTLPVCGSSSQYGGQSSTDALVPGWQLNPTIPHK